MKEKIKKILNLDKILKVSIVIAVLLVGGSVLYYLVISPSINRKHLDDCLDKAFEKYRESWKSYCELDNREIGTDGLCLLGQERAEKVKDFYEKERNVCFKKYPVK